MTIKYFEFVEKAREMGITIPIIPGIKPIAVQRHLQILPQIFRIDLPEDLIDAVDKCKNNAEIKQVGIEWAIQQSLRIKSGWSSSFYIIIQWGNLRIFARSRVRFFKDKQSTLSKF